MTTFAQPSLRAPGVRWSTAAWAAAGFGLLYLVSVGTLLGQRLDDAAMRWTAATVNDDSWARVLLTWISAGSVLTVGATVAAVTAVTRGPRTAVLGALSGAAVLLGAEVLKLALTRPGFSVDTVANSFPSGHVAAVTGLAVGLLVGVPGGPWRPAALLVAGPAVALTGLATVVLEWHRPSDVLGSMLLGVVVGVSAVRWDRIRGQGAPTSTRISQSLPLAGRQFP